MRIGLACGGVQGRWHTMVASLSARSKWSEVVALEVVRSIEQMPMFDEGSIDVVDLKTRTRMRRAILSVATLIYRSFSSNHIHGCRAGVRHGQQNCAKVPSCARKGLHGGSGSRAVAGGWGCTSSGCGAVCGILDAFGARIPGMVARSTLGSELWRPQVHQLARQACHFFPRVAAKLSLGSCGKRRSAHAPVEKIRGSARVRARVFEK